jgi:hypothetical protein
MDGLALEITRAVRQAWRVTLTARVLPILVATCLLPCGSALAATHSKLKPKPKPAAGHVGIGNAWGPVVVRPGSH